MRGARVVRLLALLTALLAALSVYARVGGGDSYSGGGSGGSGGGGGDGIGAEIIYLIFRLLLWLTIHHPAIGIPVDILVIVAVTIWLRGRTGKESLRRITPTASAVMAPQTLDNLRKFDPNFSQNVFADFCYSLYGRAHHLRGEKKLDQYSPYLSASARATLAAITSKASEVRGVVVGAFSVTGVRGLDTPRVEVTVTFEANYTEMTGGEAMGWYVKEQWVLQRARDLLSPAPEKAKADHCPRCGAALQTRTDGSCNYCGVRIESGAFQWYVQSIATLTRERRGPLLTSTVPEQGTDRATVMQPNFASAKAALLAADPQFRWETFEPRVRAIAAALQDAWTSRDWEKARPLETEPLFQMHRYWIDAYTRQKLRNVVDDFVVTQVQPVRIASDAFYDSLTVRIWASGRDYTVDEAKQVVAGSRDSQRVWTEYWTFIRSRAAGASGAITCPNCGAAVQAGSTGVCSFCGGKLTTGKFDWVLSRIEQDESYRG